MERITIACSGCGQVLAATIADPSGEVECLLCGTRTPIAARTASSAALRPGPPPAPAPRPAPPPPLPAAPGKAPEDSQVGTRWFEQTPYHLTDAPPGESAPAPAPPRPTPAPAPPPTAISQAVSASLLGDEESNPYRVEIPPERPCPGCGRWLPAEAVVCPECGFDQATGTRRQRTYQPVARAWEAGWPLRRRVQLFVVGQVLVIPLGLLGAWAFDAWAVFLGPWFLFTGITVFLLGTFARTELTRTEHGKVRLTQTWRVCFVQGTPQTIRRGDYEGVVSGRARPADFWDWVVLIVLMLLGAVLGLLWWYFVLRPDSYFVALTRDHGFPERTLYWGWDQRQAQEMERAIREVAFSAL